MVEIVQFLPNFYHHVPINKMHKNIEFILSSEYKKKEAE